MPSETARAMATTVRARAAVMPTVALQARRGRAAAQRLGSVRGRPAAAAEHPTPRAVPWAATSRAAKTRPAARETCWPSTTSTAVSNGVGAAGHPQVRPGQHERPEHRVGGERGDPRRGVDVEAEPPAADGGGRGDGIRLPSAVTAGAPTSPAGNDTVSGSAHPPPARGGGGGSSHRPAPRRRRAPARRARRGRPAGPVGRRGPGHVVIKAHAADDHWTGVRMSPRLARVTNWRGSCSTWPTRSSSTRCAGSAARPSPTARGSTS